MGAIFLSYAREDRACAERLANVFEGAGHNVWWDRHLDGGEEFGAEIEAELNASDVVVVAWSKESVRSRWVRDEAAVGGDRGMLVPVSIDGSRPPMGFRQFHTLDLTDWKGGKRDRRTAELLHSVERRLKGKAKPAEEPQTVVKPKRRFAWPTGKPAWAIVALLAIIAAGAAYYLYSGRGTPRGPLPKPTIALLPFTSTSNDPELRDLAAETRDSVSHTLSQTGIPVRLLGARPQESKKAGDFMLSADLTRNSDKIIATVRLDEASHAVTVYTQRFEASGNDIRNLPERIGVQIAGYFDGSTLMILDRRHPLDPSLIAELLGVSGDFLANYQVMKRVAAKAPNEPSTQIGVAFFTGFALSDLPRDERPQAVAEARQAAERTLNLAPEFGDTRATWCLLHSETRFAECEDQMRVGLRIDPDAPYLRGFLSNFLRSVGRVDEAVEFQRLSYAHDPYNIFKIAGMLRAYEIAGDSEQARELYQDGVRWYPEQKVMFFRNRLWGLIDRGDFEATTRLEKEVGPEMLPPGYGESGVLKVNWKSPAAVRQACQGAENFHLFLFTARCMLVLPILGDRDAAYAIAEKLYPRRVGSTAVETEWIWLDDPESPPLELLTSPAAAPMRRDPRYLAMAERTGLLAYWRSGRLPDFCRKQPEPICAQLLK